MLALRYLLITCGLGMMIAAVCILTYDLYREMLYRRLLATPGGLWVRLQWWCGGGLRWLW